MFAELQRAMMRGADVLVYIHGFNVAWNEAVGSALALQEILNRRGSFSRRKQIVVLFSWPSNGKALPFFPTNLIVAMAEHPARRLVVHLILARQNQSAGSLAQPKTLLSPAQEVSRYGNSENLDCSLVLFILLVLFTATGADPLFSNVITTA
jgi:hypothetical protein